jgi:hypothetical protein
MNHTGAFIHAMTANQRRPGFRLPWSSEEEAAAGTSASEAEASTAEASAAEGSAAAAADAPSSAAPSTSPPAPAEPATATEPLAAEPTTPAAAEPTPAPASAQGGPPADAEASPDFMRELVTAMRRVADEARQAGVTDIRTRADEQIKRLEADAARRREELQARAEKDVAAVGDWAKAEADRIRAEAEQRVVARRAQLDQQLAADATRNEGEAKALRDRVAEYERELEAYHAQLSEISDPAAFAAAAKRMPRPPKLDGPASASATVEPAARPPASPAPAAVPAASNGVTPDAPEVHPAEEEVLSIRLAELDATLPDDAAVPAAEPTTTEIVVKGLGSFGAITGFRQALSGVEGVEGVALSLGQAGEFIFRATHRVGFDIGAAITKLEGDAAKIEGRPEGGLQVTLDRAR